MIVSSPAFKNHTKIPEVYSRRGGDQRPPLVFQDIPANTKSLAIICHDPDAPGQGGFYHWTAWNLPPETRVLPSDRLPEGTVEGFTDWGENGWGGGPQPPSGTHRYIFYAYALDSRLELPSSTTPNQLLEALKPHLLAEAMHTGLFSAPNSQ